MTRIGFAVDCGPEIGMGHISRSLVLAKTAMSSGLYCRMFPSHPDGVDFSCKRSIPAAMDDAAGNDVFDWIVFDGRDRVRMDIWRARGRNLLVIDDLAEHPTRADILLNHNIYAPSLSYSAYSARRFLLGSDYALVAPSFAAARTRNRVHRANIDLVISFGGAEDGRRLALAIDAILDHAPKLVRKIYGIVSPLMAIAPEMQKFIGHEKVEILHGADMPKVFHQVDLYLGGAGVSVMEAIASGLQLIAVGVAPDQKYNLRILKEMGYPVIDDLNYQQMALAVAVIAQEPVNPPAIRIDGNGSARVLQAMSLLDENRK